MRIHGITKSNPEKAEEMKDIYIGASPEVLRTLSRFLLKEADLLEKWGKDYGHTHLQDSWDKWSEGMCDIIIQNPDDYVGK